MSTGSQGPRGHVGSKDYNQGEPYGTDPSVAPGLPRPIGWRVLLPDGLGAWDKFGPNDTDWTPVGTSSGGTGVTSINTHTGAGTIDSTSSALVVTTSVPVAGTFKVDLSQVAVADWTVGLCRVYAVDGVNGNDANKGYADPATSSAGDYAIACAAAGAVAKKTVAGLAAIWPRDGAGRTVEVVFAAGTYAGAPSDFLKGTSGYSTLPTIRGTSTNATAGAVAFAGSTADATYVGGITATGLNAGGYNPNGSISTSSIQCVKAGGGAPTFGAEPALPLGLRNRFNSATTTAALRNICRQICQVSGTDTIALQTVEPALPVGSDVFYTEQPGVAFSGISNFDGAGTQGATFVGIDFGAGGTMLCTAGRFTFAFCVVGAQWTYNGADELVTVAQSYTHPVLGSLTVGGGLRCTIALLSRAQFNLSGLVSSSNTTISGPRNTSAWGAGCAALNIRIGNWVGNQNADTFQGPNVGVASSVTVGIPHTFGAASGAALQINGSNLTIGAMSCIGAGANPCLQFLGRNLVILKGVVAGSTGNTDVGADFQNSFETIVVITAGQLPTVTGTAGDVRWSGQALVVWTNFNFQDGWDTAGNHITEQTTNAEYKMATSRSVALGVNNSGAAISAAYTLVRNNGTNLQFVPIQADTAAHCAGFFGISEAVTQNGAAGLVAAPEGLRVCQFDGAPVVGGIVYVSPGTAGLATTTIPALSGTNQKMRLGVCVGNSFPGSIGLVRWNPENISVLADGLA